MIVDNKHWFKEQAKLIIDKKTPILKQAKLIIAKNEY